MAEVERMTVVFPEPMAARIRAAVEAGEYATTSEAVRDAVRLWAGHRELRERDIERLRRSWDEGQASGDAGDLDVDGIIREAKARGKAEPRG